ncbi:MAG: cation diffusion facilitator family transporter [Candidatus Altiarchaeota archaeon]
MRGNDEIMKEDYAEVKTTLVLVLVLNLIVTLAKAVFGILANSLSMIADSLHSLFDSTSNIIGLVAVERAGKPPDSDHPYGHRKYETFATLIIALLLLVTGFEILEGVAKRLMNPSTPNITIITFLVMVSTMIINHFVSRFEHERGLHLRSPILVADSQHTKADVYASLSVLAGFVAIKLGYSIFDSLIALLIVALIVRTGFRIIRDGSRTLCDTSPLNPRDISAFVSKIPGVFGCHKVRARGIDNEVFVDLHLLLSPQTPLKDAHALSHAVERKLKEEFGNIKDVVVHIEPAKD